MKKLIKRSAIALMAGTMVIFLVACGKTNKTPDGNMNNLLDDRNETEGDICPGKELGDDGQPMARAAGLDETEDMSFNTVDTNGNPVTNEIFAGTERGVHLVFWQTDSDKTVAELEKLNDLVDAASEYEYKIIGVVMDGEENAEKAKELTKDLNFENIIWNDEVASRYEGVEAFFSEEFHEENKADLAQMIETPKAGNPVTTRTNSRGQMQTSCALLPINAGKIEEIMKDNDNNMSYEELIEQERSGN